MPRYSEPALMAAFMMAAATSFSETPSRTAFQPRLHTRIVRGRGFLHLLDFQSRFDAAKGFDQSRPVQQGTELRNQPLVDIDRQEPAVAVDRDPLAEPAPPLQRGGEGGGRVRVVGIAFDVRQKRVEPRVHRFEAAQNMKRLAGLWDAQALEGVITGGLLAAEIKRCFPGPRSGTGRSLSRPFARAGARTRRAYSSFGKTVSAPCGTIIGHIRHLTIPSR